jgi:nucleoside-diphosphate-sugar epimerase
MKSALVTGGAGFIGSHLVRRLVSEGVRTHLIVRQQSDLSRLSAFAGAVEVHRAATDMEIARAFRQAAPQVVFHLASQTRAGGRSAVDDAIGRVSGDLGFLLSIVKVAAEAATPPKAFVRAASLAEYGAAPPPYREEDRLQPLTPYGASMAACSEVLSALAPSLPFRVAQGRLALVYGPGQSTSFLIAQMVENLSGGRAVEIRNPEARRDLIFIDDAVDGLMALANRPEAAGVFNICTGTGVSMREAAAAILNATGADRQLVRFGAAPVTDGAQDLWGSPDHTKKALDWRAETTFQEGVAQTILRRAAASNQREATR